MTETSSGPDVTIRRIDVETARTMRDQLADLYEIAYADKLDGAFRSRTRFLERLDAHLDRDTDLVTAEHADELIGYIYGFPLPPGTGWWTGFDGHLPDDLAALTKAGKVFAIAELMVTPPWRRRGIARRLHDALLAHRSEAIATMLVDPANTAAMAAYEAWGWRPIGHVQPFPDSPHFESRILVLNPSSRHGQ